MPVDGGDVHGHAAAGRRELDGVRQQVPDHLLQPRGIGADADGRAGPHLDLNFLRHRRRRDRVDGAVRDRDEIHALHLEPHVARHAARDVEDVVHDPRLRLRVALDGLHRLRRARLIEVAAREHPRPPEHRRQRRPHLVRQRREEFVLQPVQFVRVAEQPRVLDRHRDAPRELLDELDVRRHVLAPRFLLGRAERHHADDAPAHVERRADVRVRLQRRAEPGDFRIEPAGLFGRGGPDPLGRDDGRASGLQDRVGERDRARRRENALDELADDRLLVPNDVPPRDVAQVPVLVLHEHVAVVAEPGQRQVDGAIERLLVVERGGQQRAHLREKRR
jgi:hypothetical protein